MIWNLLHPLPQFLGFDLIQHRYYFTPPLQLLLSYSGYCVIFDKIRVETVEWVETNSVGPVFPRATRLVEPNCHSGCGRIFAEKITGAYSDRPQLAKAIAALGEGDQINIVSKQTSNK
jgi:hypothetical protein